MKEPSEKQRAKNVPASEGRPKGVPNKTTTLLKDAILQAASEAGGQNNPEGLITYLRARAIDTPGPFLALVGKVLPMQISGTDSNGNPSEFIISVVKPKR
jgi:hypothetical protein